MRREKYMEGWYVADQDESQFPVSTGRLNIRVTNLPEFKKLLKQAEEEAEQLKKTIRLLQIFDLKIDFDIKGDE